MRDDVIILVSHHDCIFVSKALELLRKRLIAITVHRFIAGDVESGLIVESLKLCNAIIGPEAPDRLACELLVVFRIGKNL